MDTDYLALPAQMERRAATASFIVYLYEFTCKHGEHPDTSNPAVFAELPVPPEHIDRDLVQDCRSIAATLARAKGNEYEVPWSADEYAKDVGRTVLNERSHEEQLMLKYPPLIDVHEVLNSTDEHLPIIDEPAVFVSRERHVMLWSLPDIIPNCRQTEMLKATRCLEAQLTTTTLAPNDPVTKQWRTAPTFFSKGVGWKAGTTLLYPAGFAQGHTGARYPPAPSVDAKTQRAKDWMAEFETSGGLLDGILAVTHPDLYRASQELASKLFREHGRSRALMELWPSCYNSIQVISNRETPLHRDISGSPGWLGLLLSLGTYTETGVLEIRNLGVCVPYGPGAVDMLDSRLLVHGVPKIPGDRIAYACYMNKHLFKQLKIKAPGWASLAMGHVGGVKEGVQGFGLAADVGDDRNDERAEGSDGGTLGSLEDAEGSSDSH